MRENPVDVGAMIRTVVTDYCRAENVTQVELCRRAGVDPTQLSRSFHQENATTVLRRLCEVCGFHVALVRTK